MRAALSPVLLGLLLAPALVLPAPAARAQDAPPAAQLAPLSAAERAHLVGTRETLKLARDLYVAFYDAYPDRSVFRAMERDEAVQMGRVGELLFAYALPDPAGAHGPGVFETPAVQQLFTASRDEGLASYAAALRVSARTEERGLAALAVALDESTMPSVDRVFEGVARSGRRHLRLFVQALAAETGEAYAPHFLSREAFDAVVHEDAARVVAATR